MANRRSINSPKLRIPFFFSPKTSRDTDRLRAAHNESRDMRFHGARTTLKGASVGVAVVVVGGALVVPAGRSWAMVGSAFGTVKSVGPCLGKLCLGPSYVVHGSDGVAASLQALSAGLLSTQAVVTAAAAGATVIHKRVRGAVAGAAQNTVVIPAKLASKGVRQVSLIVAYIVPFSASLANS